MIKATINFFLKKQKKNILLVTCMLLFLKALVANWLGHTAMLKKGLHQIKTEHQRKTCYFLADKKDKIMIKNFFFKIKSQATYYKMNE